MKEGITVAVLHFLGSAFIAAVEPGLSRVTDGIISQRKLNIIDSFSFLVDIEAFTVPEAE